jgi:hypothetical protein
MAAGEREWYCGADKDSRHPERGERPAGTGWGCGQRVLHGLNHRLRFSSAINQPTKIVRSTCGDPFWSRISAVGGLSIAFTSLGSHHP